MKKSRRLVGLATASMMALQMSVISPSVFAGEANPDLSELATTYGYDTDTFGFYLPSCLDDFYDGSLMDSESINALVETMKSSNDGVNGKNSVKAAIVNKASYGMAVLPILVHNGVVSPESLQDGATSLHDVTFSNEIDERIAEYAASQMYLSVRLANYQNSKCTDAEKVADLLTCANRCQENGTYFLIQYGWVDDYGLYSIGNTRCVTGIGVAKGSWTYGDNTYDTCILTYDPGKVSSPVEGIDDIDLTKDLTVQDALGFSEENCIYVNSETNTFYVPAYGADSADGSATIDFATDDMSRFTYRASLNGTDTLAEDVSGSSFFYNNLIRQTAQYAPTYTATTDDGETIDVRSIFNNRSNSDTFYNEDGDVLCGSNYYAVSANSYHIVQNNTIALLDKYTYNIAKAMGLTGGDYSQIIGKDGDNTYLEEFDVPFGYNYTIDATPETISIKNVEAASGYKDEEMTVRCEMDNTGYVGDYWGYQFLGTAAEGETVTMQKAENGVIISSDDGSLNGTMILCDKDDSSNLVCRRFYNLKGSVLVTEENGSMALYLDTDGDGVYESPMEKGDVNGDGNVDVEDAVSVLQYYAEDSASMMKLPYTTYKEADGFYSYLDQDGDGQITVEDAVEILTTYARRAAGLE